MNNILIQEHCTVENCLNNPRYLYIFGDNLIKQGKSDKLLLETVLMLLVYQLKDIQIMKRLVF